MATESRGVSSIKIFNSIPEKDIMSIFSLLTQKKLKQDEILLKSGSPVSSIYVVMSGSLRVEMQSKDICHTVCNLNKDHIFGMLSQDNSYTCNFTIVANEPTAVLLINDKTVSLLKPPIRERLLSNIIALSYHLNTLLIDSITRTKQQISLMQTSALENYREVQEFTLNCTILQDAIKKIPSLPTYTYELAGMLTKETISSDRIVDHIKSDPSLMALVLKAVNSPMFSLTQKVTDFHHAVLLLGFAQIYHIVLDNSLNTFMPNKPEFIDIRDKALMVSTLGFELSIVCGFEKPLVISTIGTLHIIGNVIKMLLKKDAEFEWTYMFYDDAAIAMMVLKSWGMPEMMYMPIYYYKYPSLVSPFKIPSDVLKIVSILHLAIEFFGILKDPTKRPSPFIEDYIRSINITGDVEEILYKRLIPSLKKRHDMLPKAVQLLLKEEKIL
ncbi:MAG: HDOD domain-containing protein [Thermodesulfovibrionales bacterium]